MTQFQLFQILKDYETSLKFIRNTANLRVSPEKIFEVLIVRDRVEVMRTGLDQNIAASQMLKLSELDQQLQQRAEEISRVVDFRRLRSSFSPPEKAWWWHLDKLDSYINSKYSWFWKSISIVMWTVSLGLLLNIASRFLVGGVDVLGVTAVGLSSILALLQAKNELTDSGLEGFKQILKKLRISRRFQQQSQFIATLGLFVLVIGFYHLLPVYSNYLFDKAKNYGNSGNMSDALRTYQRAIALNPGDVDVHYQLGYLYEELHELDDAKKEYLIAVKGNSSKAYNNLARLYLQEKKYSQAASLLQKILQSNIQKSLALEYSLHKNLGWVRFEQKRYEEAEKSLGEAIQKKKSADQYQKGLFASPASAHCLMAQVRERLKKDALEEWRMCKESGNRLNSEEDVWLYLADQRLKIAKINKKD